MPARPKAAGDPQSRQRARGGETRCGQAGFRELFRGPAVQVGEAGPDHRALRAGGSCKRTLSESGTRSRVLEGGVV